MCAPPTVGNYCDVRVGCAAPAICANVTSPVTGAAFAVCSQPCNTSNDCTSAIDHCDFATDAGGGVCNINTCGPNAGSQTSATLYGACNAHGTGDGVCLPYVGPNTSIGYCVATGNLPTLSPCNVSSDGGDSRSECQSGALCTPVSDGGGVCLSICSSNGSVSNTPACGGGQSCNAADTYCSYDGTTSCYFGVCTTP